MRGAGAREDGAAPGRAGPEGCDAAASSYLPQRGAAGTRAYTRISIDILLRFQKDFYDFSYRNTMEILWKARVKS